MNRSIARQLINLGIGLLVTLFVWKYYKGRRFEPARRYSTFGPRFWTGAVDSCILWPIGFLTSALLSLNVPKVVASLLIIIESLAWLVYTVVLHARYGQTVGKMVTKVQVLDFGTERKITWRQAWIREGIPMLLSLGFLGWEVSLILSGSLAPGDLVTGEALAASKGFWILTALPGLWFVAEVLTMLTNEKRRALHDLIAGTVVVRTNTDERSAQPGASPNGGPATGLDGSGVLGGPLSVSSPR